MALQYFKVEPILKIDSLFTKNTRISYLGEIVIDFVSEDELNTELYNPHIFVNLIFQALTQYMVIRN